MTDDLNFSLGGRAAANHPVFQYFDDRACEDDSPNLPCIVDSLNAFYDQEFFRLRKEEDQVACVCSRCGWSPLHKQSFTALPKVDRRLRSLWQIIDHIERKHPLNIFTNKIG